MPFGSISQSQKLKSLFFRSRVGPEGRSSAKFAPINGQGPSEFPGGIVFGSGGLVLRLLSRQSSEGMYNRHRGDVRSSAGRFRDGVAGGFFKTPPNRVSEGGGLSGLGRLEKIGICAGVKAL